jgi:acyl-CoA thioesterase FadM
MRDTPRTEPVLLFKPDSVTGRAAYATTVARVTHVKIVHHYEVFRDGILLAEGHTTLACVDKEGKPQPLPEQLR